MREQAFEITLLVQHKGLRLNTREASCANLIEHLIVYSFFR